MNAGPSDPVALSDLDELTDEQRSVVECEKPCFVEACPGAGKTRTIVSLFLHAVRKMSPREGVAVLSFTNVAAEEVRKRANVSGAAALAGYPHFVGTFDGFVGRYLVTPFGHRWSEKRAQPRIVESWSALGVEVRRGPGAGVPLDAFELDEEDNLQLNERALPWAARKGVLEDTAGWIAAAKEKRRRLHNAGYMSCHDARICAVLRLRDKVRGPKLLEALASRFTLLIVDEAQDSNPTDLEVVEALASAGVRTVIVADRDQSIFEFRKVDTAALEAAAARRMQLRLSGNFRSTTTICQAASTFKQKPAADISLGAAAHATSRVIVFSVEGSMDVRVGARFCAEATAMSLDPEQGIALAYSEDDAMAVVGLASAGQEAKSALGRLADAVATFRRSDVDGRRRLAAVVTFERLLLRRLGLEGDALPRDIAEANKIPPAWLRRTALQLLGAVSARDIANTVTETWVEFFRGHMSRTVAPDGRQFVRTSAEVIRKQAKWSPPSDGGPRPNLCATTIHRAKGREFDSVLIVMKENKYLDQTYTAWEQRSDEESRRVYYVGVTRARRLLALAVPASRAARTFDLLSRDGALVDRIHVADSKRLRGVVGVLASARPLNRP